MKKLLNFISVFSFAVILEALDSESENTAEILANYSASMDAVFVGKCEYENIVSLKADVSVCRALENGKKIYNDLNKYLPPSKKSAVQNDKNKFESEKYKLENVDLPPEMVGTGTDVDGTLGVGDLAEKHCINLINQYMT